MIVFTKNDLQGKFWVEMVRGITSGVDLLHLNRSYVHVYNITLKFSIGISLLQISDLQEKGWVR